MDHSNPLPSQFYERDPGEAAEGLLGNILVRNLEAETLSGLIVETEAYYGSDDPASRARDGMKGYNRLMWDQPGLAFIYNVHKYWMLNIVAHEPNQVGAVLVRAIEPIDGIETMKKNRGVENLYQLTNGPGKLTMALEIDKRLHGIPVTSPESEITIAEHRTEFEIGSSNRIGVRHDLKKELRFYIDGNKFVSR